MCGGVDVIAVTVDLALDVVLITHEVVGKNPLIRNLSGPGRRRVRKCGRGNVSHWCGRSMIDHFEITCHLDA